MSFKAETVFILMFQHKSICKSKGNTLKNLKRVNSGLQKTSLLSVDFNSMNRKDDVIVL